jgi:hypothetical protein
MGNWKYLPPHGKPNPALSLNAKTFYRKKVAPPWSEMPPHPQKKWIVLLIYCGLSKML